MPVLLWWLKQLWLRKMYGCLSALRQFLIAKYRLFTYKYTVSMSRYISVYTDVFGAVIDGTVCAIEASFILNSQNSFFQIVNIYNTFNTFNTKFGRFVVFSPTKFLQPNLFGIIIQTIVLYNLLWSLALLFVQFLMMWIKLIFVLFEIQYRQISIWATAAVFFFGGINLSQMMNRKCDINCI